ncbi:hypothetical protein SERLA73DRAFT_178736 [Serpula lacrymans var. lacrymans S7.3]|uniref:Uncharacterized protein n=2 Tax=Serpula lacrymans var. lacrymans TaxID=341189 RepID=F8PSN7_SERL3|nr:uncharacterized protein SERLADRAFT_463335 [Serpula lacrymans var. lacrymans S7.9]EGO00796.1 hypothetical protein SERLA73DRAFT_178736 [Serpula lacrymans var. lacrymans S7.3]EGO26356.1 hypothetical protein SERLADRAFT_463335 [Serpula lacrymans var. lacrymans S7.9]
MNYCQGIKTLHLCSRRPQPPQITQHQSSSVSIMNSLFFFSALIAVFSSTLSLAAPAENELMKPIESTDANDITAFDSNFELLRRQSCSSGYGSCSDGGCCPLGGQCCILQRCCGKGYYCVRNAASTRVGCCPNGRVCSAPQSTENDQAENATLEELS